MNTSMRTLPVSLLVVGIAAASLTGCGSKASDSSSTTSSHTTVATSTPSASAGATSAAASSPAASAPATSASAAAQAPAGMKLVTGKGYTVAIPEAWQKGVVIAKTSAVTVGDLNYGLKSGTALMPSMNVQLYTQTATAADLPDIREGQVSALAKDGGKEVLKLDSTVDGEQAVGAAGLMTASGKQIRVRQLITIHSGKVYAIGVFMPPSASNAQAKALMEQILATWKWTA